MTTSPPPSSRPQRLHRSQRRKRTSPYLSSSSQAVSGSSASRPKVPESVTAQISSAVTARGGRGAVDVGSLGRMILASEEAASEAPKGRRQKKFEYLPHTADIQLHSWGESLEEALENAVVCMFGYMTDLNTVRSERGGEGEREDAPGRGDTDKPEYGGREQKITCSSLETLAFTLLTTWLSRFHTESFVLYDVTISSLSGAPPYTCVSSAEGERFDVGRHPQGTEVKAVTYSNLQVNVKEGRTDVYVIVDI